jgi:hypothetical protein
MCQNYSEAQVCNWMVPVDNPEPLCTACRLNRTIPDLSQTHHRTCWSRLEAAKHRLVYSLLALGLPLKNKQDDPLQGLAFDFLADPEPDFTEPPQAITGHAEGLITINIAEADDVVRVKMRLDMNERYRTVPGHFRTAQAFGLTVPDFPTELIASAGQFDMNRPSDEAFSRLIAQWLPLTFAFNSMNRSMGLEDLYPFVLSPSVIDKLRFVHQIIDQARC